MKGKNSVSYRMDTEMEKREKSSFTFLPRPSSFPPTPLFNEVLLYPAAFEALTCETESPLCFFPVHCTLKPPPNQIAHSCLVSNSVSQAMVNKPLPSPIPWQHAPFELVAVKCFFFSLSPSLSHWPSFSWLEDQEPSHRLACGIKLLIIICLCLSTLSMLGCILFCMS